MPFAKDMEAEVEERDMVEEEGWREGWRARRKGWRGALETLRAEAAGEGGREGDGIETSARPGGGRGSWGRDGWRGGGGEGGDEEGGEREGGGAEEEEGGMVAG